MRLSLPSPIRRPAFLPGRTGADAPVPARTVGDALFDEELLGRLRRLVLMSQKTIAQGLAGEHRSRRRGSSPEFADFKSYSQGDDFRRIDWNTYARLDGLFVRLSEVTTEFNVHLLLDASNSMDWRGDDRGPTKFAYARRLAGALGYVSLWRFDRVVLAPFGAELAPRFGPAQGRAQAVPLLRHLETLAPLGQTDLPAILDAYARVRRRPGLVILVSDLLSGEPADLGGPLRELRARGWQATVVHVVDPAELLGAPMTGVGPGGRPAPSELIEVESGEKLRLTPTDPVLSRYRAAIETWLAELDAVCAAEGTTYLRLQTDWPVETLVLQMLHERGVVG
ncbi:MAG: hypothetical protein AVDCRST_MAG73-122 [uncultured Thermomicrobiales bacterium]|uniref:DUF58 domain-containing protein n=1 Tax=uncultured Thermomicrobiales bacterium TaxID=1645740 RepID=A0A6J4TD41_9BACT|nr:MAG: hypothetical protein AVDCRST_MAG73-122 [uncultured Thermomicrobiales bacterium]